MKIEPSGLFYQKVRETDGPAIVANMFSGGTPVRHLLYRDSARSEPYETMETLPFYRKQRRIVLRNNSLIDPTNIQHYMAVGGYEALYKVLKSMTPDEVVDEVDRALLRGRGGAGFPAGKRKGPAASVAGPGKG